MSYDIARCNRCMRVGWVGRVVEDKRICLDCCKSLQLKVLNPGQQEMFNELLNDHGREVAENYQEFCLSISDDDSGNGNVQRWRSHAPLEMVQERIKAIVSTRPSISEAEVQAALKEFLPDDVEEAIALLTGKGEIVSYQRFLPNKKPLDECRKLLIKGAEIPVIPVDALTPELRAIALKKGVETFTKVSTFQTKIRTRLTEDTETRIRNAALQLKASGVYFTYEQVAIAAEVSKTLISIRPDLKREIDAMREGLPFPAEAAVREAIARLDAVPEKLTATRVAKEAGVTPRTIQYSKPLNRIVKDFLIRHNHKLIGA